MEQKLLKKFNQIPMTPKEAKKQCGKVTELVEQFRNARAQELLDRWKHLIGVWSIKEYLDAKPDIDLNVEIRLLEEEIERRISKKLEITK